MKKYNDDSNNDFVICNIKKVKMRLGAGAFNETFKSP